MGGHNAAMDKVRTIASTIKDLQSVAAEVEAQEKGQNNIAEAIKLLKKEMARLKKRK